MAGFLCLFVPTFALAQARGDVQSVGFDNHVRPGCWTPLLVRLTPTTGTPFNGRIEVVQDDLDKDEVIFTRQINLTGNNPNGPPIDQRFWMYFIPQPNRGDRETIDDNLNPVDLTRMIKVRLCSDTGKELIKLPITTSIRLLDNIRAGTMSGPPRGRKAVLAVSARSRIDATEYQYTGGLGLTEDVGFHSIPESQIPYTLPDDVRGYDAIDAILWGDADPLLLTPDQLTAVEGFVRRGGKLVFVQDTNTNQWQRNGVKFPLLMPVTVQGVEERGDLFPLRHLARGIADPHPRTYPTSRDRIDPARVRAWEALKGPFRYAAAQVNPGAFVAVWQTDDKGEPMRDAAGQPKPYVVRRPVGAGSVTWVAQDLGDKQILGERVTTTGWTLVWDAIFDWPNEPALNPRNLSPGEMAELAPYAGGTTWELGRALFKYMDLPSTSAALIGIAVLFAIVYWVAAGPGSYFVLLKRGKASLSWFMFGAIAIGGTALTIGIVKAVLRGAPQLQHVTLVRVAPGEPAMVHSDFGLYIPRDGYQRIELKDAAPNRSSYVTAFNLHPAFNQTDLYFPARQPYVVPVKEVHEADREVQDPKVINVPYRSTLKKFQAQWVGNLPGGIEGSVKLGRETPFVQGKLTNKTGRDLRRVYLVVNNPVADTRDGEEHAKPVDVVLHVSYWAKDADLKLTELFGPANSNNSAANIGPNAVLVDSSTSTKFSAFRGYIFPDARGGEGVFTNWTDYWYGQLWRRTGFDNREYTDEDPLNPNSFPILSFFNRLPVSRNQTNRNAVAGKIIQQADRFDFLRRGRRDVDVSAAVSAGNMAVIAVSDSRDEKLPFPLEVQGDRVEGKGLVYYQFVLPVDRSAVTNTPANGATTQPATQPKGKAEG
jgi:hypothetical protein